MTDRTDLDIEKTIEKYNEYFYEFIRESIIRGIVFAIYDRSGPQTMYTFPPPIAQSIEGFGPTREQRIMEKRKRYLMLKKMREAGGEGGEDAPLAIQEFTKRDYLQIAIKSVSLLIGEKIFEKDKSLLNMSFFGVLPYPDLDVCTLTYFTFYPYGPESEPRACTFSLLIDYNKRAYIYENIDFLKDAVKNCVNKLIKILVSGKWLPVGTDRETWLEINMVIFDFISRLRIAESKKFTPITSKRHIKIVFAGKEGSGKTSYLLTINRKYSELLRRDEPGSTDINIASFVGTTIVNWDLGHEMEESPDFKSQYEIYLYDANLLYYFIDACDVGGLRSNYRIFENIMKILDFLNIDIPIIVIISKVDQDLADKPEIRKIIHEIKEEFRRINSKYGKDLRFFETSIFDITTILRSFSTGVELLIPARDEVRKLLHEYALKINADAILVFNENGLRVAEYCSPEVVDIPKSTKIGEDRINNGYLQYVLEIIGPQVIEIYKNFENSILINRSPKGMFRSLFDRKIPKFITYLGDNRVIYIQKLMVGDYPAYVLLYINEKAAHRSDLHNHLTKMADKFTSILIRNMGEENGK